MNRKLIAVVLLIAGNVAEARADEPAESGLVVTAATGSAEANLARILTSVPRGSLAEVTALGALGELRASKGDAEGAEMLFREALEGRARLLGEDHESAAPVLERLARVLLDLGRMDEVVTVLRLQLAIDDAADRDHPQADRRLRRINALALLASIRATGRDEAGAETLLRRAVALADAAPKLSGPEAAHAINLLGKLLVDRGDHEQGEHFARRALGVYENLRGPGRAESVNPLITLSAARIARGDTAGALALLRRAGREAELGHAGAGPRAAIAANMGALWMAQGQYHKAEVVLERALDLAEGAVGATHPALIRLLQSLADCHRLRHRTDDAATLYHRASDLITQTYGPRSPALIRTFAGLAMLDEARGDAVRAEARFREGLSLADEADDPESRAVFLGDMAAFYDRRGAMGAAEQLYIRALASLEGLHNPDPLRSVLLKGLASVQKKGRRAQASRALDMDTRFP